MTSGYQALTQKEKETLRLLVDGYDAKSMARHLGLSVHTVNERLRDARRKMAVSSSREAARLMRAAENADPEKLGHKHFGDASPGEVAAVLHADAKQRPSRRLGWIVGGTVMSIIIALLGYATLSPQAEMPTKRTNEAVENAPAQAARQWLEMGDRSDWANSYAATAASFRSVNTLQNWQKASLAVRVPLGRVIKRQLIAEVDAPTPPNGNMVVRFRTDFASRADAVETVALAREEGAWRVVGVYIE